jgi:putative cardiolipin synthase
MRLLWASLMLLVMGGCAGLPPRPDMPASHALTETSDSRLAKILEAATPVEKRGLSGFRLLPEGPTAFNARVALARRAEKSIDAQYYLIQDDDVGQQFLRELRDAANRGVRVRLLVDDLYAGGEDELFAGLAAHPNVEVRVFNPLPVRAGGFTTRLLFSMHQFGRINHRMHNKLFIADNSFAVSGGRNIANEYFMRSESANFIDIDVLSSGPVVRELSNAFDSYWNSDHVFPIGSLVGVDLATRTPEAARARFDELVRTASPVVPEREHDVMGNPPVAQQLDSGALQQTFAPARVFADSPDKVAGAAETAPGQTVTEQTLALFASAHDRVDIVSPYFIPGPRGLAMMQRATAAGGRISLVTNSIGATDEPLVHDRYARYRLAMLKAGVRIYEISPTLARRSGRLGDFGRSTGRLHAKTAVIDRHLLFIGSMNLDARSARANTEIGLVIDSAELIRMASATLFTNLLATGAYELRLTPDWERIQWVQPQPDGTVIVHDHEPESAWLLRLKLWLLAPFVGEELL